MNRNYPAALTSYDLLKFTALMLMVIDHLGAFFFPEYTWMRVAGRFSAPMFLFLIGYARSRDLSWTMIVGTLLILLGNFVMGQGLLPLSILAVMLVGRAAIDPLMDGIARVPHAIYPLAVALFLFAVPTMGFLEYGTAALLFVMIGYVVRNAADMPLGRYGRLQFVVIASGLYALLQVILFTFFDFWQGAVSGLGIVALSLALTCFRPAAFESLTRALTPLGAGIVKIGGRWSLEFYVFHFILFKAIAVYLSPEKPDFFSFHIF